MLEAEGRVILDRLLDRLPVSAESLNHSLQFKNLVNGLDEHAGVLVRARSHSQLVLPEIDVRNRADGNRQAIRRRETFELPPAEGE